MNPREKAEATIQYGFKRITPENVTELDYQPPHLFRRRNKAWVQACLKPQLDHCVPEEIAFLFEVARGSMVYGMFFAPVASLATEQLYRVLEAGARLRCEQLGLLKRKPGKKKPLPNVAFAEIVTALKQAGTIPAGDSHVWDGLPFLRNRFSHPKTQSIQSANDPPAIAAYTADLLNRLFK